MPPTRLRRFYTLGELAELSGLSRRTVLRLLRRHGVRTAPPRPRPRERIFVSVRALQEAFPDLLESAALLEQLRE